MPQVPVRLACTGCGAEAAADRPWPFRCAAARTGDGIDHVIARVLDAGAVEVPPDGDPNPFVRYRGLHLAWHLWRAHGHYDSSYVDLVRRLDAQVAEVDGRGFSVTPFVRRDGLSDALGFTADGGVWVKDETAHVAGSHKARHLMGILLYLEVMERLGLAPAPGDEADSAAGPTLAIASCGNAALAAAVLARAARRALHVFVPPGAAPAVQGRLAALGARINTCPRQPGEAGDPCYLRFQGALGRGSLPFCCQGSDNGLTIEGGMTLAWEIAQGMASARRVPDRVFVQVGGGALASACVQGLRETVTMGVLPDLPRVHAVQTRGAYPLARAYDRLAQGLVGSLGARPADEGAVADLLRDRASAGNVREALRAAARGRREFMWPWEEEPHSIAEGILDDETYDWHAVTAGMLESGGWPVVVDEDTLREAHAHGVRSGGGAGGEVSHTGVAGLAGLVALCRDGRVRPTENVVVVFSGVER